MGSDPDADDAFRSMYYSTFEDVRRFCLRRLPPSDVNDAISEIYLVAWQKAAKIPEEPAALLWLYGVARNVVRHMERSNRRRLRLNAKVGREPVGAVSGPDVQVVRRSEDEELAAAIERLSVADREVIRLRGWEGLTAPAIAEVLGCSVAAAEKRISRAFQRLEQSLTSQRSALRRRSFAPKEGGA